MKYEINYQEEIIKVSHKKIRNFNLKVNMFGEVFLSVPNKTSQIQILKFIEEKYSWISDAKNKLKPNQKYLANFTNGSQHFLFGKEYKLHILEDRGLSEIYTREETIIFKNPREVSEKTVQRHLLNFYKSSLILETERFFAKWEKELNVQKKELKIKKMKGKWGYCEFRKKIICLNTELAKRNLEFVEYVVLHELCHLIEPNHGPRFKKLLDTHMPNWRIISKSI